MHETGSYNKRLVGRPPCGASPERIRALRSRGWSFREIARATGYGYGTVRRAFWGIGPVFREDPRKDSPQPPIEASQEMPNVTCVK